MKPDLEPMIENNLASYLPFLNKVKDKLAELEPMSRKAGKVLPYYLCRNQLVSYDSLFVKYKVVRYAINANPLVKPSARVMLRIERSCDELLKDIDVHINYLRQKHANLI